VLVALGSRATSLLPALPEVSYLIRGIERPGSLPPGAIWLPFPADLDAGSERRLLAELGVDVLLCRASGGSGAVGKIVAARELGLPVVMLGRPPPPAGVPMVADAATACSWLERLTPPRATGLSSSGPIARSP
jgi:precorrin-6A/cobalt-precorrin-6A reductase